MDAYKKFIEEQCTGEVFNKRANGLSYLFYTMKDGWIAIFENNNGNLTPKTQAKDMPHAESYIGLIEPAPVWLQEIC